jgi:hypothetical protein
MAVKSDPQKTSFPTFLSGLQLNVPRGTLLFHAAAGPVKQKGAASAPRLSVSLHCSFAV